MRPVRCTDKRRPPFRLGAKYENSFPLRGATVQEIRKAAAGERLCSFIGVGSAHQWRMCRKMKLRRALKPCLFSQECRGCACVLSGGLAAELRGTVAHSTPWHGRQTSWLAFTVSRTEQKKLPSRILRRQR